MRTASFAAMHVRRGVSCLALSLHAVPALAMTQCPPEFGPKPMALVAIGWGVLALFVVIGGAVAWGLWRRTRRSRLRVQLAVGALALVVMLAIWCAGLLVWLGVFVLPC